TWNGKRRPDLGVANGENGLFITVVDFNLPAVEVMLQQFLGGSFQVGAQQVSGLAVIDAGMNRHFVRDWGNNDQPQQPGCRSASPEHVIQDLVLELAAFTAEVDAGLFPRQSLRLQDVFGCEDLGGILASGIGERWKTEPSIFAATG